MPRCWAALYVHTAPVYPENSESGGAGLALEAVRGLRTFQTAVLYVGVVFELGPLLCALSYGCLWPWPRVEGTLAGVSEGPSSWACNTGLHKRKPGPDSKFPPFPLLVVKSAGPQDSSLVF